MLMRSLLLLVVFSGCVTMTPDQIAARNANAAMEVTCDSPEDCEIKWAAALDWIQRNSHWKLRNVTDSLITTEGPFDTTQAAFEVTKFPRGGGVYEIRFRAACGNMFGCVPSILDLTASFKSSVGYRDMTVAERRSAPASVRTFGEIDSPEETAARSITIGTTKEEITAKIGRPPDEENRRTRAGQVEETWTYRFGQTKIIYRIEDGKVAGTSMSTN
jgi:hypothetical protein